MGPTRFLSRLRSDSSPNLFRTFSSRTEKVSDLTVSKYFMSIWPNSISGPRCGDLAGSQEGGRRDDNSRGKAVSPGHSSWIFRFALQMGFLIVFMYERKGTEKVECTLTSEPDDITSRPRRETSPNNLHTFP